MTRQILIIEDDPDLGFCAQMVLQRAGFAVSVAANGQEGLNCLQRSEPPTVIVLDVNMPLMGGEEFLRCKAALGAQIRAVPVVVFTNESDPGRFRNLPSVVDCIPKSLTGNTLAVAVERAHKNREATKCIQY